MPTTTRRRTRFCDRVVYRSKPKKGYFWQDEIQAAGYFLVQAGRDKRKRAPPPPKDKASWQRAEQELAEKWKDASEKAVKMITKLNKDPGTKARNLASFAKKARAKFVA